MYERILIPLDGSETAEAALAYAELLPSRRARLIQVQPNILGPVRADPSLWEAWQQARQDDAAVYLERAGQSLRRQGRTVEATFRVGDPTAEIIAGAADADLIVMTTRGRGTAGRALFGSVADSVARQVPIPTLLVRVDEHPMTGPPVTRVVVPLDGSALAEQALPVAAAVATDLGVPVHLVRVLDLDALRASVQAGIDAASAYIQSQESVQRHAEEYLAERAQELRNRDLAVTAEVLTGSPALTLLDAIRRDDLVVMTTHGRGGVRRWLLGSVADKLVRAAAAPVLLVRTQSDDATAPAPPTNAWNGP
jgi:nucleotide-binding universal stress UspA family protein